jgi:hypothetical protein
VAHALPGAAQQAVDLIMEWQTGRTGQGASNLQIQHG